MDKYLYRGVNPDMYDSTDGQLVPKAQGQPFKRAVKYGQGFKYGEVTFGGSAKNSVVGHQRDSSSFRSSGVSTTPIFDNAKEYATHGGQYLFGYVYKIDTDLLDEAGVDAHRVSEHAPNPAIPEDEEVILVAKDFGTLPAEIIVEIVKV
ncbi:MAG: hypothetical protein JRJ39_01425 [Deltaproteobacteria bacterium]|nr:hypothetical protein [Deltaproteobacteria bacterium]